jgi:hypothetical protein
MTSIIDIFRKYSAIETTKGTDKITSHSYGEVYDSIFTPFKTSATDILEIGISGGFGLQSYVEYFTNATIYGMDITMLSNTAILSNPRIKIHIGDATRLENVHYFGKQYDIIIEDASHLPEHQIQHFQDFCGLLKPGGYYIMEDLNQAHFDRVSAATKQIADQNGLTMTVHDLRNVKGRFDDIMLVFQKN